MSESIILMNDSSVIKKNNTSPDSSRTLRDLVAVIFRHRALIIISFLVVFLCALVGTWLLPNEYEAHLKILVKRERMDPVVTPASNSQPTITLDVTSEDLNSEVELLKSRDLLEKVVVACGLQNVQHSSLLGKARTFISGGKTDGQDMKIPMAVRQLEQTLEVEPIGKSKIIEVRYFANDPKLAARVLDSLSALYLEKHLGVHRPAGVLDFFQQQTDQYRNGLESAEKQLAQFSNREGVVSVELEKEIAVRKLSDAVSQMQDAKAAEAAAEQKIRSLESQLAATPVRVTTQVRTSDNSVLLQQMKSTLLTLEMKRTELLTRYEPTYPLVQEVDQQIAQARESIAQATNNPLRDETTDLDQTHAWLKEELAKARAELSTLRAKSVEIAKTVEEYRANAGQLNQKEIAHQALLRSAKTAEENYLLYLRKQEEARISDALDRKRILNATVAEAPTVPAFPSNPNWILNLGLGLVFAFGISLGLAFAVDYSDSSFRTPDEVENYLEIKVLAALPLNR